MTWFPFRRSWHAHPWALLTLYFLTACNTISIGTPADPNNPGGTPASGQPGSIAGTLIFPGSLEGTSLGDFITPKGALNAAPPSFIPGEVIVKFTSDLRAQSLSVQGLSMQRAQSVGLARTALYRAPGLDERQTLNLVDTLNARSDVVYAEPNTIRTVQKVPNDTYYPLQWHYDAMNLPAAWDIEDGVSSRVTVAVIDTGSVPHPDMQGAFVGGYDFVSDPANAGDGDGYDADPTDLGQNSGYHGTHVAGTVAARSNNGVGVAGVSWGAQVVPIRTLGVTGGGTLLDTVNGLLWAAGERVQGVPLNPNPAQIINLSLGGEAPCGRSEQEVFDTLRAKGITVVVAAGNENIDVSRFAPANCEGVITVGATGPTNARAPYSNYGAGIDVMAPGGDSAQTLTVGGRAIPAGVLSPLKDDDTGRFGYGFYQGTSMAAPHVAGLVALMLAKEPGLEPGTVLERLKASAEPLTAGECERASSADCGAGLVNAALALGGSAPRPTPPTTRRINTYVFAFYCRLGCSDIDFGRSREIQLPEPTSLEVPFQFSNMEPGTYRIAAWQDVNNDVSVDDGEPFGTHPVDVTLTAGQSLTDIDIYLSAFTSQATVEVDKTLQRAAEALLD